MYTPVSIVIEEKKKPQQPTQKLINQILSFSAAKLWIDRSLKNTQSSF